MRTKKNFSKAIVIVLALAAIATFTAVFNDGTTSTPVAPESTGSVDYVNDPEAVYNHEDVTTNGKTWDEVLAEREERDKDKNQNNSSNNNNDRPVKPISSSCSTILLRTATPSVPSPIRW